MKDASRAEASPGVAKAAGIGTAGTMDDLAWVSELLRACVDVTPDVYFVKDWDHRLLLVSRSLAASMGLSPSDMENHLDSEFWPIEVCEGDPETGRRGYHEEDRDALQGKDTRVTEHVVLGDGDEHTFQTDRVPLRDSEGNVVAILGFARDITASTLLKRRTKELENTARSLQETNQRLSEEITARRQAEDQLRQANIALEVRVRERTLALSEKVEQYERAEAKGRGLEEQLRQSQKLEAIGRLAGGIAHDFNNLLQVINCGLELIAPELPQTNSVTQDFQEVCNAAQRAGTLTSQLLAFARRRAVLPETIEVNDAITALLSLLRRIVGDTIVVEFQPTPEACWVVLGTGQLDQVLTNLVINAGDAITGEGEIRIETALIENEKGQQFVRISVNDTGTGMDEATSETIFEPFFTTKSDGRGTGLGLSTVYGIVHQHGGEISLTTEPNSGTTFYVDLPRRAPRASAVSLPKSTVPRGSRRKLLLVEDEEALLEVVTKMLSRAGYEVIKAHGPREALEIVSEWKDPVDLMITDVAMPEITGRGVVERVRRTFPDLPVLYMSGHTANVFTGESLLERGVHYIQKPFTRQEIVAQIESILHGD